MDKYHRSKTAEYIAQKIEVQPPNAGAFAIGISGKWGTGKTSFCNLIKNHLNDENTIIIDFNPWRSHSPTKIIEDFFELLIKKINYYDPSLSKDIADYANSLLTISESKYGKLVSEAINILFSKEEKKDLYGRINDALPKIPKKILVFIDDVDRLNKLEIIEVLRLIRNTANFNNVVYVICYDKEYVNAAIKIINECDSDTFLEKIIPFEFNLPKLSVTFLRNEIASQLQNSQEFDASIEKQITIIINTNTRGEVNFTDEIVKNSRDVIRLCNSFIFDSRGIITEISIHDFYLIQLLKLKFINIYNDIYRYKSIFFLLNKKQNHYYLRFRRTDEIDKNFSDLTRADILSIQNYQSKTPTSQPSDDDSDTFIIKHINNTSGYTEIQRVLITKLVTEIFSYRDNRNLGLYANINAKSIIDPNSFYKYFSYQIPEGEISYQEFDDARQKDFSDYKEIVNKWLSSSERFGLIHKLKNISIFNSVKEYENHIRIMIHLERIKYKEGASRNKTELKEIAMLLSYPTEHQDLYNSKEDYKNFLQNLLINESKMPQIIEGEIIEGIVYYSIPTALSQEEYCNILCDYFRDFCKENSSVNNDFFILYKNTRDIAPCDNGDIKDLAVDFFIRKLTACELGIFIRQETPNSNLYRLDDEQRAWCFPEYSKFKEWLNTANNLQSSSKCIEEMKSFLAKYEANNNQRIEFAFNSLKPIGFKPLNS
ncbi:KAP family P-loop NTPase fold protein [Chitinophaga polysaccharea]|uniref:KAP family P-loop NTPase fold protein n=1 Tax=Chitinophaga polysaccharea TaxID=1293035 RepID=UPI00163CD80A|nr:P-loop NTPase fold protein [Chitinophaga polysaccharea]